MKNNFKLLSFLELNPEQRLSPEPRVEWEESSPYTWIPNTIRCFTSLKLLKYSNLYLKPSAYITRKSTSAFMVLEELGHDIEFKYFDKKGHF